jgi:hypothetical protein
MKRTVILVVAMATLAVSAAGVGVASERELPPHAHMLLLGYELGEVDGVPALVGWRACVDLAAGRAVPLHAHHDQMHVGRVGDVLADKAGNAVVGTYPLAPWTDCASFEGFLPLTFD